MILNDRSSHLLAVSWWGHSSQVLEAHRRCSFLGGTLGVALGAVQQDPRDSEPWPLDAPPPTWPWKMPLAAFGDWRPAVPPHKAVLRTEQGVQAGNSDVNGGASHLGLPQVWGIFRPSWAKPQNEGKKAKHVLEGGWQPRLSAPWARAQWEALELAKWCGELGGGRLG